MLSQAQLEIRIHWAISKGLTKHSLDIGEQMSWKLILVYLLTYGQFVSKHYIGINFRVYVLSTEQVPLHQFSKPLQAHGLFW